MGNPFCRGLLLLLLLTLALSPPFSAEPPPSTTACKSTLYPKLCLSILSAFRHSPSNNSDTYGKFSIKQCIKRARRLSDLIRHFLTKNTKQKSLMSFAEIGALDDCQQLQELNVEYLELISGELKSASEDMSDAVVGRVRSLLSAVVTNQQTCYDGLADAGSGMVAALAEPLGDAAAVYSVSLGLVAHALGRGRRRGGGVSGPGGCWS
ncbi:hypothetical protein DH2020_002955 [Rehmannia glutinosa]|uniref:Pectinesterase inhibitor domain-containing protein n=1 Tax=Rehmannia glutinosa TaxID=99300 RepID=A0ABR0XVA8_REHGL